MADSNLQYGRKVSLLLVNGEQALNLSDMHIRFQTSQQDEESPSNCAIRVYNLSDATILKVRKEYARVVLQAGYEGGAFGVIFDGTIKQFRTGKEPDNLNTYLDILAADGDIAYNFAVVNASLRAGSDTGEKVATIIAAMKPLGVVPGNLVFPSTGGTLPRGKVLFGMAKALLRSQTQSIGATWSIQDGKVNVTPLTGYLPGDAVVLSAATGLIGRPEQTADGIRCRCLLNPKIQVGGLVKIDNSSVNQTLQQDPNSLAKLAYNQWAGVQNLATVTTDGIYRVYISEFVGDSRGQDFYTEITCLTVNPVTNQCLPFG